MMSSAETRPENAEVDRRVKRRPRLLQRKRWPPSGVEPSLVRAADWQRGHGIQGSSCRQPTRPTPLQENPTNAIGATCATLRLGTNETKGAGSWSAGLAMADKLPAAAQARWRSVNAPHLVALVRAGATFVDGLLIEREDQRCAA